MAITQDDLDRLDQAIARGVRKVTVDGQTTEYASTAELIQARETIARRLGQGAPQTRLTYVDRGFDE